MRRTLAASAFLLILFNIYISKATLYALDSWTNFSKENEIEDLTSDRIRVCRIITSIVWLILFRNLNKSRGSFQRKKKILWIKGVARRSNEYSQRRGSRSPPFLFRPASFPFIEIPSEDYGERGPKCTFLQEGRTWNHYDTLFYIYIYFIFSLRLVLFEGSKCVALNAPGKMWQNNDDRRQNWTGEKKSYCQTKEKKQESLFLKSMVLIRKREPIPNRADDV